MIGEGVAGVLLEEAGKGRFAHAGAPGPIGQVDIGRNVLVDEGQSAAEHVERLLVELRREFRRGEQFVFLGADEKIKQLDEQ
ncbi:hypothetical protein D9M70_553960 [compost metagenome]